MMVCIISLRLFESPEEQSTTPAQHTYQHIFEVTSFGSELLLFSYYEAAEMSQSATMIVSSLLQDSTPSL